MHSAIAMTPLPGGTPTAAIVSSSPARQDNGFQLVLQTVQATAEQSPAAALARAEDSSQPNRVTKRSGILPTSSPRGSAATLGATRRARKDLHYADQVDATKTAGEASKDSGDAASVNGTLADDPTLVEGGTQQAPLPSNGVLPAASPTSATMLSGPADIATPRQILPAYGTKQGRGDHARSSASRLTTAGVPSAAPTASERAYPPPEIPNAAMPAMPSAFGEPNALSTASGGIAAGVDPAGPGPSDPIVGAATDNGSEGSGLAGMAGPSAEAGSAMLQGAADYAASETTGTTIQTASGAVAAGGAETVSNSTRGDGIAPAGSLAIDGRGNLLPARASGATGSGNGVPEYPATGRDEAAVGSPAGTERRSATAEPAQSGTAVPDAGGSINLAPPRPVGAATERTANLAADPAAVRGSATRADTEATAPGEHKPAIQTESEAAAVPAAAGVTADPPVEFAVPAAALSTQPHATTMAAPPAAMPVNFQIASPAEQIAPALLAVAQSKDGVHRMTLRLHPADLGMVQVQIERGASGPARVQITVERADTLHLMQQDQSALLRTLDYAGIPAQGRTITFHVAPVFEPQVSQPSTVSRDAPTPTLPLPSLVQSSSTQSSNSGTQSSSSGSGGGHGSTTGTNGGGGGSAGYATRDQTGYPGTRRTSSLGSTAANQDQAIPARWQRAGLDITA